MSRLPDEFTVVSPGRVNLIGEHTDYNDGFVLPLAIDRGLRLQVCRRPDGRAVLTSDRGGPPVEIDLDTPIAAGRTDRGRYVAGVLAGYQRLGWSISGFEARITADLPAARLLERPALRDVSRDEWATLETSLPDPERRRARHVITENDLVHAFATTARAGDWPTAGRLMRESHASLRDDFQVSCPELDRICVAVDRLDGVFGCRMTGGGFGGSAVALLDGSPASGIEAAARAACTTALGHEADLFLTAAAAGTRVEAHA